MSRAIKSNPMVRKQEGKEIPKKRHPCLFQSQQTGTKTALSQKQTPVPTWVWDSVAASTFKQSQGFSRWGSHGCLPHLELLPCDVYPALNHLISTSHDFLSLLRPLPLFIQSISDLHSALGVTQSALTACISNYAVIRHPSLVVHQQLVDGELRLSSIITKLSLVLLFRINLQRRLSCFLARTSLILCFIQLLFRHLLLLSLTVHSSIRSSPSSRQYSVHSEQDHLLYLFDLHSSFLLLLPLLPSFNSLSLSIHQSP
ncbi:uncharacterized protein BO95DRAFT_149671 [Aspergillus brunneoviolaceus CBS 621.78]|uniref:Uncharacterized protein n=1 Tax=Aspergillus brunneoviolaceus CBS 621.78 TaxID=1450534 RepID=A0ACD1G7H2_9EURO|nr:hypothetical protein BO95DRAFT_149671 [Aspergillus brunneoviolaceus CBS 621.78]RAH45201.1 hypothetical protein BO95DRAFT_149671 [Aspergillus brunneoviolaceus CBS 621.78]